MPTCYGRLSRNRYGVGHAPACVECGTQCGPRSLNTASTHGNPSAGVLNLALIEWKIPIQRAQSICHVLEDGDVVKVADGLRRSERRWTLGQRLGVVPVRRFGQRQ